MKTFTNLSFNGCNKNEMSMNMIRSICTIIKLLNKVTIYLKRNKNITYVAISRNVF